MCIHQAVEKSWAAFDDIINAVHIFRDVVSFSQLEITTVSS